VSGGFLPSRPGPAPGDGDPIELHLPSDRAESLRRWELRAAEWRAVVIAEAAFGGPVEPRLLGAGSAAGFRGLVELRVPFEDLGSHREAEDRFLAWARRDELLGRLPLIVVFTPRVRTP
jgi:hypothetical protein